MIELTYTFRGPSVVAVTVRLHDVEQARPAEHPAPWDVGLTISWGAEVAFDRPLAGADPLHAVEMAASYAARYLHGRAEDEGGTLDPPIPPPI